MRIRASFLVVAVLVGLPACGSDESDGGGTQSSCASDPLSCGAGKTCWIVDASGKYDCIAATTDKPQGSACQNMVGAAQCNEGMQCFPDQSGSPIGSCQPFCAKDKTCSGGALCAGVSLINAPAAPVIYVCAPTGTGGTGGTGGTAGSGGSGGSTGGTAGSGGSTGGAAGSATDAGSDASDASAE